jgi:hypothetical protein
MGRTAQGGYAVKLEDLVPHKQPFAPDPISKIPYQLV